MQNLDWRAAHGSGLNEGDFTLLPERLQLAAVADTVFQVYSWRRINVLVHRLLIVQRRSELRPIGTLATEEPLALVGPHAQEASVVLRPPSRPAAVL